MSSSLRLFEGRLVLKWLPLAIHEAFNYPFKTSIGSHPSLGSGVYLSQKSNLSMGSTRAGWQDAPNYFLLIKKSFPALRSINILYLFTKLSDLVLTFRPYFHLGWLNLDVLHSLRRQRRIQVVWQHTQILTGLVSLR